MIKRGLTGHIHVLVPDRPPTAGGLAVANERTASCKKRSAGASSVWRIRCGIFCSPCWGYRDVMADALQTGRLLGADRVDHDCVLDPGRMGAGNSKGA